VSDEFLKFQLPFHVLLYNIRKIGSRLVVTIGGALKSPLIQQIYRMSFECIIFAWHSNKYSNTPTLKTTINLFKDLI
jgi:hypothetical protein